MRISFTGTRRGMTPHQEHQLRAWLEEHSPTRRANTTSSKIIAAAHGMCGGADEEFHLLVRKICGGLVYVVGFPSTASTRSSVELDVDYLAKARAPLERNPDIVNVGKDLLIAAPATMGEVLRSGTWATVRYARKVGVPVLVMWPR